MIEKQRECVRELRPAHATSCASCAALRTHRTSMQLCAYMTHAGVAYKHMVLQWVL